MIDMTRAQIHYIRLSNNFTSEGLTQTLIQPHRILARGTSNLSYFLINCSSSKLNTYSSLFFVV